MPDGSPSVAQPLVMFCRTIRPSMVVTSTMSVSDVVIAEMPLVAAVHVRVPSVASIESSHSEPSVLAIIHPLAGLVPGKMVSLSPTSNVRPSIG